MPKLFIIGNARSGTTVLLNAINTSPNAFILGEASFNHLSNTSGFRETYNTQHRNFGNQRSKSTYAPALPGLPDMATGHEYLERLELDYEWAGEKIAIAHHSDLPAIKIAFEREWWNSEIIWSLRRPRFALASMTRIFGYDDRQRDINVVCRALLWLVDLARTRSRVFVFPMERLNPKAFEVVGRTLGLDLSEAHHLYTSPPIDDLDFGRDSPHASILDRLDAAYETLLESVDLDRWIFPSWILQSEQHLPGFKPASGSGRASAFGKMVVELMSLERETRAGVSLPS